MIATTAGLPIAFAFASAKADERETCADVIRWAGLARPDLTLIVDKGHCSNAPERHLDGGITLIRSADRNEPARPHHRFLRA